jgi:hypothetical protein
MHLCTLKPLPPPHPPKIKFSDIELKQLNVVDIEINIYVHHKDMKTHTEIPFAA